MMHLPSVDIYGKENLDQLNWPKTEEAVYAKRFLTPLIQNGVSSYIENVETTLYILKVGDKTIPLTVNEEEYENSFVCSPYTYYIGCAREYLPQIASRLLRKKIKLLLLVLDKFFRKAKLNRTVQVNNWLFATNLYPSLAKEEIAAIRSFLTEKFPQHAILFRSLAAYHEADCPLKLFTQNQFRLIASRPVYFTNLPEKRLDDIRALKKDIKLLKENAYEILEEKDLSVQHAERFADLYQRLYINKHSQLNPRLNARFVALALKENLLHFRALKKGEEIKGVVGFFERNGVVLSPFFGYDLDQPKESALYRQLSALLTIEAKKREKILHQSSGAAAYKKIRGAESRLEYFAVYDKHLPLLRKTPWLLLQKVMNVIGVPLMHKYEK